MGCNHSQRIEKFAKVGFYSNRLQAQHLHIQGFFVGDGHFAGV